MILDHLKKEWSVGITREADTTPTDCAVLDAAVFQCLQTVNRFEVLPQIKDALRRGSVVFDRFTASGLVYGKLDGLDPEWVEKTNASLPQPDVWIYLDIPVEESFRRRPERRDRYEQDRAYLEKVRLGYRELFERKQRSQLMHIDLFYTEIEPGVVPRVRAEADKWRIVDGMGTPGEVHARILESVRNVGAMGSQP